MAATAKERREMIVVHLARNQVVKVSDLSRRFGISEVSIRRDLDALEELGLLKHIHGGAVPIPYTGLGHSHSAKTQRCIKEKKAIGRVAAEMLREGDRIVFDSGTTVVQVARNIPRHLLESGNLTVITASLPIVRELGSWKDVQLLLLGGIYLPDYEIVAGPQTIENLKGLHVDKIFLGTDGLTFSHGVTTANVLEAEVNRAMVGVASETIVVADSSKIGVKGLVTIMPLVQIDRLITDDKADPDFVAALEKNGVQVILGQDKGELGVL